MARKPKLLLHRMALCARAPSIIVAFVAPSTFHRFSGEARLLFAPSMRFCPSSISHLRSHSTHCAAPSTTTDNLPSHLPTKTTTMPKAATRGKGKGGKADGGKKKKGKSRDITTFTAVQVTNMA
jgi:hypothetical protein